MATKQVIALDVSYSETEFTVRFAFWFAISKNPVPRANGSAWGASGTSAGASAAENSAIEAGTIVEELNSFNFPVGTPVSAIEAVVQQAWAERNAQLNGQGGNQFYGDYWDGTQWGFQ